MVKNSWRSVTFILLASFFLLSSRAWPAQGESPAGAVVVGDRVLLTLRTEVAGISAAERAAIVNLRIEQILTNPALEPQRLEVQPLPDGTMLLTLGNFRLLGVTLADAAAEDTTTEELAQRWSRLLRDALLEIKPIYRPRHAAPVSFLPLVLVSLLAFGVPVLASHVRRFPLPVVVGEILVGILVGRSGLGLVHYDSWLQFLAEFGFAYLMFLAGLEVDFSLLAAGRSPTDGSARRRQASPAALAVGIFLLTLLLAGVVAAGMAGLGLLQQPGMMLLVLSTTSLGMVVPILKERGLTGSLLGQTLLLAALVADFVTMFLVTIVAGWLASGPTLHLFVGLLLLGAFVVALRLGRALTHSGRLQHLLEGLAHATSQIEVRGSLALLLIFVALSEQLGTEVILGAFLAGVLLSLFTDRESSDLHHKLEALGFGFFIPIFFIMVGVRFDLHALVANPRGMLVAPLLVLGAFLIKIGAALPLRRIASWRETLAGGLLLSSRLSLIIAAAEIGLRIGLFTPTLHAAIICVALATCIGGPIGFQLLMPAATRQRRRAVIVGGGEHSRLLAGRLESKGWDIRRLDREPGDVESARAAGRPVAHEDGIDPQALQTAGIEEAEVVIAASSSEAANEAVCREAGRLGVPRRIALVYKSEAEARLREEGALPVTPLLSTVIVLEGLVTHSAVFRMLTNSGDDKQVVTAVLQAALLAHRPLRELTWPGDVLVLSIERGDEVLVPHGHTSLRKGDVLTLIGSAKDVQEAMRWMNPRPGGEEDAPLSVAP
jgi:Kef-type K+ transport system membrane component KefB/Trk K+ transport system NAD-binding subunit